MPPRASSDGDVTVPLTWVPGLILCGAVTVAAILLQQAELAVFGRVWLEPLVLAILTGAVVRTVWAPPETFRAGIGFSAKLLLEIAIVLLGASVSAAALVAVGPALLGGIVGVVAVAIAASFAIGRMLGLSTRLALLVACGNSICGNSAIAAVAPVIRADSDDVAASIAFTAVLGVAVVLGLPLLAIALHLSVLESGALAGLTVYAVPQVIAATAPFGATAVQMGTLVKLVRVLMLGPVCVLVSLIDRARAGERLHGGGGFAFRQMVPWFILGFLFLLALRTSGLISVRLGELAGHLATTLTIVSMAALGLGVDMRTIARAGGRVTLAVVLSLAVLAALSLALIDLIRL